MTLNQVLKNRNFENEFNEIIINNDKPVTITDEDNKVKEGEPKYTDAKENGRSGVAIAKITKNTLAIYTSENIEYPEPVNWSNVIKNAGIYNKSHILAYRLSAKNSDYNNIFIGTEYLNQTTMKNIENNIYQSVKKDNREYLYKVTPYYYKEDIVPFGILIEAKSIDNFENKTYCRFCYNIQKGYKINYYDGGNKPIEQVYGKREVVEIKEKQSKETAKYQNYAINIKTKTFHLEDKYCGSIKNVDPKYIQGTRASIDDIIGKGYKLCKKCTKV